jgi:hypothetical protein
MNEFDLALEQLSGTLATTWRNLAIASQVPAPVFGTVLAVAAGKVLGRSTLTPDVTLRLFSEAFRRALLERNQQ